MTTHKLRALVVGAGSMGMNHARVLSSMPDIELVVVADPDNERLRKAREKLRVQATLTVEEAIKIYGPHLAVIAAPNHIHVPLALTCLRSGIPTLIEKPVASALEGALMIEELDAVARAHYGPRAACVAVGHIERFNPAVTRLRQELAHGNADGAIYEIRLERYSPFPFRQKEAGVALDLASHDLDLLRFVIGQEPKLVGKTTRSQVRDRSVEDLVSALYEFPSGIVGAVHVNWLTPKKIRRLTLTTRGGYYEANLLTQELWFHANGSGSESELGALHGVSEGEVTGYYIPREEPLLLELQDFVDAIRERRAPRCTLQDGIRALELALELQGNKA